jgi:hypothetical protein
VATSNTALRNGFGLLVFLTFIPIGQMAVLLSLDREVDELFKHVTKIGAEIEILP